MLDSYNLGSIGGNITPDARAAITFYGSLSDDLIVSAPSNQSEGQQTYLKLSPNGFLITISGVSFPSGTTFPTATDLVVRITKVGGAQYGELLLP